MFSATNFSGLIAKIGTKVVELLGRYTNETEFDADNDTLLVTDKFVALYTYYE